MGSFKYVHKLTQAVFRQAGRDTDIHAVNSLRHHQSKPDRENTRDMRYFLNDLVSKHVKVHSVILHDAVNQTTNMGVDL